MEILQFLSGGFDILFTDLNSFRRNLLSKMAHANYMLRVTKKKQHYMKAVILRRPAAGYFCPNPI